MIGVLLAAAISLMAAGVFAALWLLAERRVQPSARRNAAHRRRMNATICPGRRP